jgi:phosphatidylserine/phosphatidylglycerophosphate/cardiolipin synthase-like enzyme
MEREDRLLRADWLLLAEERGNPSTVLDSRHPDGAAWTTGNQVRALIDGASYFRELLDRVRAMRAGDLLLFTDWRGDPDERLDGAGTEVSRVLADAARRGVVVRGLIWRSHLDRFRFSAEENRHLGDEIEQAGGMCLLDMRVRTGGSHHQKFVVLRHPGRPERDVAYVGGIDLCHGRRDDTEHRGDPQAAPMAQVYGSRPPWHDVQVEVRGPAVADVETVFRERWDDPTAATRNPIHRLRDALGKEPEHGRPLPPQLPDPAPCGSHTVQLLRTYPYRRRGYPFAPRGERSIARGVRKAMARARSLVYFEDQYLWSPHVAAVFAEALAAQPELRLIAVIPLHPDVDGPTDRPPELVGRLAALDLLAAAGGDRFALYGLENHEGTPVYVHAKVCVVDDRWATVGSDNLSRRSWTFDTELSCAVIDEGVLDEGVDDEGVDDEGGPVDGYPRRLRLALAREHLDLAANLSEVDDASLCDATKAFDMFARAARELDAWHDAGRVGPRPPGRLRTYRPPAMSRWTRAWAGLLYKALYDPDGRPPDLRRAATF